MAEYVAPLKDMQFVLKHVVGLDQVNKLPGWEEVTEDVVDAILEEAGKLADEVLSPLNAHGRPQRREVEGRRGHHAAGLQGRLPAVREGGLGQHPRRPSKYGGQGLPHLIATPVEEMWGAANLAFKLCPMLTQGAIEAIDYVGPDALRAEVPAEHGLGQVDRHHEPDRAAGRQRPVAGAHQGRAAGATAPTASTARRSSSPTASTTTPRTSSTWCWRASTARPRA